MRADPGVVRSLGQNDLVETPGEIKVRNLTNAEIIKNIVSDPR